jgi:hypothetical protein
MMQAIAAELGLRWRLVRYGDADFNGIFDGLLDRRMDCIASGTWSRPAANARRCSARPISAPDKPRL